MNNEEGWSAAEDNDDQASWSMNYVRKNYSDNYAAARRSIAKSATDIDDEFELLLKLGLM